jgi:phosphoribosylpyrophosphate synthetase
MPVDSLTAGPLLCDALRSRLPAGTVVVSPDAGRLRMATRFAERLQTSVVLMHKVRESDKDSGDASRRRCPRPSVPDRRRLDLTRQSQRVDRQSAVLRPSVLGIRKSGAP